MHSQCSSVGSEEPVDVELPNQWLWDIIDEFIYQVCVGEGWEGWGGGGGGWKRNTQCGW